MRSYITKKRKLELPSRRQSQTQSQLQWSTGVAIRGGFSQFDYANHPMGASISPVKTRQPFRSAVDHAGSNIVSQPDPAWLQGLFRQMGRIINHRKLRDSDMNNERRKLLILLQHAATVFREKGKTGKQRQLSPRSVRKLHRLLLLGLGIRMMHDIELQILINLKLLFQMDGGISSDGRQMMQPFWFQWHDACQTMLAAMQAMTRTPMLVPAPAHVPSRRSDGASANTENGNTQNGNTRNADSLAQVQQAQQIEGACCELATAVLDAMERLVVRNHGVLPGEGHASHRTLHRCIKFRNNRHDWIRQIEQMNILDNASDNQHADMRTGIAAQCSFELPPSGQQAPLHAPAPACGGASLLTSLVDLTRNGGTRADQSTFSSWTCIACLYILLGRSRLNKAIAVGRIGDIWISHLSRRLHANQSNASFDVVPILSIDLLQTHAQHHRMQFIGTELCIGVLRQCIDVSGPDIVESTIQLVAFIAQHQPDAIRFIEHPGFIDAMCWAASDIDRMQHTSAFTVRAVQALLADDANSLKLCRRGKVLDVLVESIASGSDVASVSVAVDTVMQLAKNPCNRRLLAKHRGLIASLIRFIRSFASVHDESRRDEIKRQIKILASAL